mmetsp:Transcript_51728/g.92902  ORF Transcript_51728/g.92902 Transcript_51728/m.92902 type:complete len:207 (+) Transcript_51728:1315-1935(+)
MRRLLHMAWQLRMASGLQQARRSLHPEALRRHQHRCRRNPTTWEDLPAPGCQSSQSPSLGEVLSWELPCWLCWHFSSTPGASGANGGQMPPGLGSPVLQALVPFTWPIKRAQAKLLQRLHLRNTRRINRRAKKMMARSSRRSSRLQQRVLARAFPEATVQPSLSRQRGLRLGSHQARRGRLARQILRIFFDLLKLLQRLPHLLGER